ncbi:hypothetical protein ACFL6L_04375, partial [candidate division KSB1 bacterium]
ILNIFINDPEIKINGETPVIARWHPVPFLGKYIIRYSYFYLYVYYKFNRTVEALGIKESYSDHLQELYDPEGEHWKQFQQQLTDIAVICRRREVLLFISILPILVNFDDYPYSYAHESLHTLCSDLQIPYIDLLPYFQGMDYTTLWINPFDGHPNEQAHTIIANAIYQHILNNNIMTMTTQEDVKERIEYLKNLKEPSTESQSDSIMRLLHCYWLIKDYKNALSQCRQLLALHPDNNMLLDIERYLNLKVEEKGLN